MKYSAQYSCLLLSFVFLASSALALDPTKPTQDYIRKTFAVEDGLGNNVVNAILQSRDGFLWIGTNTGLVRFNGRDFTPVDLRRTNSGAQLIQVLAEGPDGSLWVGTDWGVVRIPDVEHYDPSRSAPELYRIGAMEDESVERLEFTRDGVLLAGTSRGLFRLSGTSFKCILAGVNVQEIKKGSNGRLFIVANYEFLEWSHDRIVKRSGLTPALAPEFGATAHETVSDALHSVMQDRTGAMWFCTHWGLMRQDGDITYHYLPYRGDDVRRDIATYEDGQGTVWVVRDSGIYRADRHSLVPLLTGVTPRSILADRDGNLWIGTNGDGLIRFRDRPVHMFTTSDGLPAHVTMAVLERHDGSIWAGSNCGGLSRFDGRRFTTYNEKNGLHNSCVWALAEDANDDLWIGTWGGGAFRFKGGRFEQLSRPQGLRSDIVRSIAAAPDGSLWFATDEALTCMRNGHLRNYTTADGLSSNNILAVYVDRRGGTLAATSAGIDQLNGDRFVPLTSAQQLLNLHYASFWDTKAGQLYAFWERNGIGRIEGKRLTNVDIGTNLDLLGMTEFRGQELWFSSENGIFRFPASSGLLSSQDQRDLMDYTKFGRADGLNSTECSIGSPNMVIDREGRLWVATVQGLAMIDLPKVPHQRRLPAIFIEEVTIDDRAQQLPQRITLRPGKHHLEIKFDAIALTSPEKIRFQYRLDGVEKAWRDAGSSRTAVYTTVPIGAHSFHIRACNRDGVWDYQGIAYPIVQQPSLYETRWFRLAAFAVLIALAAGIYRVRVEQIAAQFNARMEERSNERLRIARELHDTLLQSFQGLLLRFQATHNLIPEEMKEVKTTMAATLDRGTEALTEARESIENLRESVVANDLARELSSLCEELRTSGAGAMPVEVEVKGRARELDPMLRDDVFRIVSEALRNAFKHAKARRIQMTIAYGNRELQVQVIDDGKGIDPEIAAGRRRKGHWGLSGMLERARSIGGHLDVWSAQGLGTKIILSVPAARAYSKVPGRLWLMIWGRTP